MGMSTTSTMKRTFLAGAIGNVLEWYDFALYGYFAPVSRLVLSVQFSLGVVDLRLWSLCRWISCTAPRSNAVRLLGRTWDDVMRWLGRSSSWPSRPAWWGFCRRTKPWGRRPHSPDALPVSPRIIGRRRIHRVRHFSRRTCGSFATRLCRELGGLQCPDRRAFRIRRGGPGRVKPCGRGTPSVGLADSLHDGQPHCRGGLVRANRSSGVAGLRNNPPGRRTRIFPHPRRVHDAATCRDKSGRPRVAARRGILPTVCLSDDLSCDSYDCSTRPYSFSIRVA